jgi:hypothetical protein
MVFESVGGVDEDNPNLSMNLTTWFLDVKSVHLVQCENDLIKNDELHLAAITIQAHKWKLNNKFSFIWGLFAINDKFPIDFKNPLIIRRKMGFFKLSNATILVQGN